MKLTETILHKAALYPVVAFDVFDTLIKRDVARPTDLFALLGADFAKARTQAEAEARAAKSGEVTLAEIYARPCLAGYDPAAECAAEIACAVPNLPVLKAATAPAGRLSRGTSCVGRCQLRMPASAEPATSARQLSPIKRTSFACVCVFCRNRRNSLPLRFCTP